MRLAEEYHRLAVPVMRYLALSDSLFVAMPTDGEWLQDMYEHLDKTRRREIRSLMICLYMLLDMIYQCNMHVDDSYNLELWTIT